jgi:hypothetical protein
MYKFNFPTNRNNSTLEQQQDSDQLVDSVEPIENGRMIATKCALHGVIYIWDLKEAIQNCDNEGSLSVVPIHILNYSNTDNYFMSMGSSICAYQFIIEFFFSFFLLLCLGGHLLILYVLFFFLFCSF